MRSIFIVLVFFQFGLCKKSSDRISALRNDLLNGYEKDANPDGQIEVKIGIRFLDMELCPHKQVKSQSKINCFCLLLANLLSLFCHFLSNNSFCIGMDGFCTCGPMKD